MICYLDNSATRGQNYVDSYIINAMSRAMDEYWENPSSQYSTAQTVKEVIDECRHNVAKFIGAKSNEIYFTSGGSESNNMVLQGFVKQCKKDGVKPIIFTSNIEHKSIIECMKSFKDPKIIHKIIPVDDKGFLDLAELERQLKWLNKVYNSRMVSCRFLVSCQLANNEIGTIQDVREISNIAHRYNAIFHTDAVQAFGHIHIDVEELGIDLMSASGHKVSSVLKGIGFLYKREGIEIQPLIYGSQENGLRGGTENTFGIIGLDKAIQYCDVSLNTFEASSEIRDKLIEKLVEKFDCKLNGSLYYRLPNNINITFPQNITGESLLYTLDMVNVFISVGSACNSKSIKPSHVLKAIGLTDEEAMRTIRVSLPDVDDYELEEYNELLDKFIRELEIAIKLVES